jgi:hypothetical protein
MQSLLARCWVVLLALALVGGNLHARLHARLPVIAAGPAAPHASHDAGGSDHTHHHDKTNKADRAGQCCCLYPAGCATVFTTADGPTGFMPADYGAAIRYGAREVSLNGRVLLPDPKPPRPGALT